MDRYWWCGHCSNKRILKSPETGRGATSYPIRHLYSFFEGLRQGLSAGVPYPRPAGAWRRPERSRRSQSGEGRSPQLIAFLNIWRSLLAEADATVLLKKRREDPAKK